MSEKQNINDIPIKDLPKVVEELGLKSFTASQIIQWIYKKGASSFDEMTNLSKDARELLKKRFKMGGFHLLKTLTSKDGTKKFAWKLDDGSIIESVLIPSESHEKASKHGKGKVPREEWRKRLTLCISTQVGCLMGCTFCRTGDMGFKRDLSVSEIIGQVLEVERILKEEGRSKKEEKSSLPLLPSSVSHRISNVVLMGMGEPLANYDNVLRSLHIMLDTKALGLSKRHVTLSTCGLVPEIEKFASDNPGVKLAISLNATLDELRERTMPINRKYPIAKLFAALKKYSRTTGDRITFEYVIIEDVNDSNEDAKRLVKLLSMFPSKVNLIPLNACHPEPKVKDLRNKTEHMRSFATAQDDTLRTPPEETVQRFAQFLRNKHIQVNIRNSRGQDILAACGLLASE